MNPQIDFNHPAILRGNLEQLIPQLGLKDLSRKIPIGRSGGIGFILFEDKFNVSTLENTFDYINTLRTFYDAVDVYLDIAKEHATKFGFRLLASNRSGAFEEITPYSEIFPKLYHSRSIYGLVIGDQNIESLEKLVRFLEMVKERSPILDQQYEVVRTVGKSYLQK